MTIHEASQQLLFQLYHIYPHGEAANIADLVMENITGWQRIDRVINKSVRMSAFMEKQLREYTIALNNHTPVQYVLHEAWFYGMKLYVDENVLIPRQETEELVEWVIQTIPHEPATLIDIGTGSGCIAIALKKHLPMIDVVACDISEKALAVARRNADLQKTPITFIQANVLSAEERNKLPIADYIVSNPPYIPLADKKTMQDNVLKHEPHLALFTDDPDPLVFYQAIKNIPAKQYYFETHESYAGQVAALFDSSTIKTDMQGKNRMVKASEKN